jgi:hypothetical protein
MKGENLILKIVCLVVAATITNLLPSYSYLAAL